MQITEVSIPASMKELTGKKVFKAGDLFIIQTIDDLTTKEKLMFNFGTDRMPVGKYKHTSISHRLRYPNWDEIREIKEQLHGDIFVFQMLPPKALYDNMHPNCFHIWEIL